MTLTVRQEFVKAAMQGMVSAHPHATFGDIASAAVNIADETMEEEARTYVEWIIPPTQTKEQSPSVTEPTVREWWIVQSKHAGGDGLFLDQQKAVKYAAQFMPARAVIHVREVLP